MEDELTLLQEQFKNAAGTESVKILKKSPSSSSTPKDSGDTNQRITVPDTITSSDNLFGGIVTDIIEKNLEGSDSESDEETPFLPRMSHAAGFPKALKRTISSENQQSASSSLKTVDNASYQLGNSSNFECGKLEWISNASVPPSLPSLSNQEQSKSEIVMKKCPLRFGFKGQLLYQRMTDFASDPELYHHGNDPDKAGYTIDELNILAKSTFASQRVLAFNIFTHIWQELHMNGYGKNDTRSEILSLLHDQNILFSARIGLDSPHETVVDSALNMMSVYFGVNTGILDVFDEVLLMERGFRTISLDRKTVLYLLNASSPVAKDAVAEEDDDVIDMTIEYIQSALRKDALLGIVLTAILPRFRFLLSSKTISASQIIKIIHILSCVAMHSPSCAEDILACDGMVDVLQSLASICISECFKDELLVKVLSMITRLFRLISVSSQEACLAILKSGIVDLLMTSLSLRSINPALCKQAILLLDACFCYSFAPSLLDKYHTLIFSSLYSIVQSVVAQTSSTSVGLDLDESLFFISAISKMLTDVILRFGSDASVGGVHDMIYPFAQIFLQVLEMEINTKSFNWMKGQVLRFLTSYVIKAMEQQHISSNAQQIVDSFPKQVENLSLLVESLFDVANQENFAALSSLSLIRSEAGDLVLVRSFEDLLESCTLEQISACLILSEHGQFASSVFNALLYSSKRNWISKHTLLNLKNNPGIDEFLNSYTNLVLAQGKGNGEDPMISVFGFQKLFVNVGMNNFIKSFLDYSTYIGQKFTEEFLSASARNRDLSACLLNSLLPGDDSFALELLEKELGASSFGLSIIQPESVLESKSLFALESLHVVSRRKPRSFLLQCGSGDGKRDAWTGVPFSTIDWLFAVPTDLYRESKSAVDEKTFEQWILLVDALERRKSSLTEAVSVGAKFSHLLHTFLLYNKDGEALFRCGDVSEALQRILGSYDWTVDVCLHLDGLPNFFALYQELLDQFVSESYGNAAFAKALLLPLSPLFSSRFQNVFWTKMQHSKYLALFCKFTPSDLCRNFDLIYPPSRESCSVVNLELKMLIEAALPSLPLSSALFLIGSRTPNPPQSPSHA